MGHPPKFALLLIILGLVSSQVESSSFKDGFGHCKSIVKNWAVSSLDEEVKEDRHTLQDLLLFLHIPRTGGRTYFHCFLRKLYSASLECPRSYDKLRFDPSKTNCRLLATHDDFSIVSKLPRERTSVATIFRNPLDRVFSTYEFSIEVAARFLVHPNLTSVTQMAGRLRSKTKGVSTLDIWPWKYLVPWMREDLFGRRDGRAYMGSDYIRGNDSYNMGNFVMPLHDYINDPIAREIVHNGATFQVAGLTNNSYLAESHEVRHCVQKYTILGEHVLEVAKKRLKNMLYVGLTEDHRESATMFANIVGSQVISQLTESDSIVENEANNKSVQGTSDLHVNDDHQSHTEDQNSEETTINEIAEATKETMTVGKLIKSYETCISGLRKSQARRRVASLKKISPANFSKEARLRVPEAVLQQIISLNNLDLELYKFAQDLFAKQQKHTTQNIVPNERVDFIFSNLYGVTLWNVLSVVIVITLLILLSFPFLNARRRTSKVKI